MRFVLNLYLLITGNLFLRDSSIFPFVNFNLRTVVIFFEIGSKRNVLDEEIYRNNLGDEMFRSEYALLGGVEIREKITGANYGAVLSKIINYIAKKSSGERR